VPKCMKLDLRNFISELWPLHWVWNEQRSQALYSHTVCRPWLDDWLGSTCMTQQAAV